MVELKKPVSIFLSSSEQIQLIFGNAYIKDINKATVEMYMGTGVNDKSFLLGNKSTSLWTEKEYLIKISQKYLECMKAILDAVMEWVWQ